MTVRIAKRRETSQHGSSSRRRARFGERAKKPASHRSHGALFALLVLALGAGAACGDDESSDPQAVDSLAQTVCSAGVIETDLEVGTFSGPGVDPATSTLALAPGSYVVSATYGAPNATAQASGRWGELFAGIDAQLKSQPGLLAVQLSSSTSCGSGRTLAVWRDTDAMYDFVASPAHLEAMRAAGQVLKPGFAVTHWTTSELAQISNEEGARRLGDQAAH
jgi:heme-degrading monooxygenase HmoA